MLLRNFFKLSAVNPLVSYNSVFSFSTINAARITHSRTLKEKVEKKVVKKKSFEVKPKFIRKDRYDIYRKPHIIENYKDGFTAEELEGSNELVKKALRLNNANTKEILQFRIKQAVAKYQKFPNDTGSTAVQVASMSERILHLANHVAKNRSDKFSKRALQQLIDQRRIMLNYLRRTEYHYYKWIVADYNIPDHPPLNAHHKENFHLYQMR